ncbi:rRNA methyltransferase [Bacillus sp. FJAT-22090]|uniref:rRNA methyltransferase n=1 Tax=Bacillus sp. FJAT-22090 TaxID=1581038 RepID=UPI0011A68611|nr:rRNA methyltransferase [Bacillus sp. FJAT-22090]
MWKVVNGRLIQSKDESRIEFRTNISKSILNTLKKLAEEHNTHQNYLLESGLKQVLINDMIDFKKEYRPKDRIQYKTTYDCELLEEVKKFAKKHHLYINDVIEYSVQFIQITDSKKSNHRYRIEREGE